MSKLIIVNPLHKAFLDYTTYIRKMQYQKQANKLKPGQSSLLNIDPLIAEV